MEKRNRAAVAAPNSDKDTKKKGIINIETAKIIHFLFGTPTAKMPIKKEVADETI